MRRKKSANAEPAAAPRPSHADIAALAHSYWQAEGCPEGAECRHWFEAEAALVAAAKSDPKGKE